MHRRFSIVPIPANGGGSGASRPSWRRYPRLPKHHDRDDGGAAAADEDEDEDEDDADRGDGSFGAFRDRQNAMGMEDLLLQALLT